MRECDMTSRERALYRVQKHSFAADDIRLFLDTHPTCREALAALHRQHRLEREATLAYERCYGPLTLESMTDEQSHVWIEQPWPWEVEA